MEDYQVTIFDPADGNLLYIFDAASLYDLKYSRVLNGIGKLALTLSSDHIDLFTLDTFVEVTRTSPLSGILLTEETYLTRIIHRFREGDEERLIIGGVSLNHLLKRRLIDPDDDPLSAGGESIKAGPADSVMRSLALEQMGSLATATRQWPEFSISAVPGGFQSVGGSWHHENLLVVFQDLATRGEVDFEIVRTSGRATRLEIGIIGLDLTKGTNYPGAPFVLLQPERGNMAEPSLEDNREKQKNYVYILARGQGDDRIVFQVAANTIDASPYNRIEFKQEARKAKRGDTAALLDAADTALKDERTPTEFSFATPGTLPGGEYRNDWDFGDKVSIAWGDIERDVRVTEVEITVNEGGEEIEVTTEQLNV